MRRFWPVIVDLAGAGALGQQLGVTGVAETGQVHSGLIERRGHDGVRLAGCGEVAGGENCLDRGPTSAALSTPTGTSAGSANPAFRTGTVPGR